MGKDLWENSQLAKQYYATASEILEYDIAELSFNGPEESLKLTQYTQPAIFVHSIIAFKILQKQVLNFSGVAGHSLGEVSAMVAADILSFADALQLVKIRSTEMALAGEKYPGSMAAIIGADESQMDRICKQQGIVVQANLNAPGQVVISGQVNAISEAVRTARSIGIRKAVKLNVSGAFHSPLMSSARMPLSNAINKIHFSPPSVPIYQNVTALPESDIEVIKNNLLLQLESPVKWSESILNMISVGHSSFIEIGPGKVLQGLNRRIDRQSKTKSFSKFAEIMSYEI